MPEDDSWTFTVTAEAPAPEYPKASIESIKVRIGSGFHAPKRDVTDGGSVSFTGNIGDTVYLIVKLKNVGDAEGKLYAQAQKKGAIGNWAFIPDSKKEVTVGSGNTKTVTLSAESLEAESQDYKVIAGHYE